MSEPSQPYDESRLVVTVGLILLSLDSVSSRFGELGLDFVRPDLVKRAARAVLQWLAPLEVGTQSRESLIRKLAEVLENAADDEDAKRAAAWLKRVVSMRRCDNLAHYWGSVLLLFTSEYASVLRQLGMRAESASLLDDLAESWGDRVNEFESLAASLDQSVESEWDRAQYREYQRESDLLTPISFLSGWLRAEAFVKILAAIAKQLNPQELKLLEAWGMASATVQTGIHEASLSLEHLNEILSSCSGE